LRQKNSFFVPKFHFCFHILLKKLKLFALFSSCGSLSGYVRPAGNLHADLQWKTYVCVTYVEVMWGGAETRSRHARLLRRLHPTTLLNWAARHRNCSNTAWTGKWLSERRDDALFCPSVLTSQKFKLINHYISMNINGHGKK
jgi:hypothetical protein